jgi:putative ABC transport system permease protein
MFKNYLKVAFRNSVKHKFYALLNVLGLGIGMACCLLILLYVTHELSYDTFHSKADRIYRVVTDIKTPTETLNIGVTSTPMAAAIKADLAEVEDMVRMDDVEFLVTINGNTLQEDDAMIADASFFQIFDFSLRRGDPQTALEKPLSIVLTEDAAKKYFGDEDPMGQRLLLENEYDATVTGVMENVPENASFDFEMLLSMSSRLEVFAPYLKEQWGNFTNVAYVLLAEQTDPRSLETKLPDFLSQYISEVDVADGMDYTLFLEPLQDVYYSERGGFQSGNMDNVRIFTVIVIFILLIACINFMNLSTARASERAKEVGVRKVIGAVRRQLTIQFLFESVLLSLVAAFLAVLGSELLLPVFNQLAGKTVANSFFDHTFLLYGVIGVALLIGILAGIYPALVLSRFKSSAILKGRFSSSKRGVVLRKALVVTQFAMSIMLIIGTAVVYAQLSYMRNQSLGFKKEQVLVIDFRGDSDIQEKREMIKQQLGSHPQVASVSMSSSVPGRLNSNAYSEIVNPGGEMQATNINLFYVDHQFLEQYEMQLAAGRFFSEAFSTDSSALIVNEALVASYGYASAEDIIGKRFSQWGVEGEIIGVVKNYHFRSLQQEIAPMSIRLNPQFSRYISLNLTSADMSSTLAELQHTWMRLAPQRPFHYFFMDEAFDQQYRAEERFGQLFIYFSGLAIFIACLGLLGLISYTVVQRTKEIGIRKVLGATEASIVSLLSRDFLTLVLVAFVVAIPVAWFTLQQWLAEFAYRTTMPWWAFALAGLVAMITALLTVGFQSLKAAVANPVVSLRSE